MMGPVRPSLSLRQRLWLLPLLLLVASAGGQQQQQPRRRRQWSVPTARFNGLGLVSPFPEAWSTSRTARQRQATPPARRRTPSSPPPPPPPPPEPPRSPVPQPSPVSPASSTSRASAASVTKLTWAQSKRTLTVTAHMDQASSQQLAEHGRIEMGVGFVALRASPRVHVDIVLGGRIQPGKSKWELTPEGIGTSTSPRLRLSPSLHLPASSRGWLVDCTTYMNMC
jgi:hypothetical protein